MLIPPALWALGSVFFAAAAVSQDLSQYRPNQSANQISAETANAGKERTWGNGSMRATTVRGEVIYLKMCAECHGQDGTGSELASVIQPPVPDITSDKNYRYGTSREAIKRTVTNGVGARMLGYRNRLAESQIDAVVDYVISLKRENSD